MKEKAIKNLQTMTRATNYNRWLFNKVQPYLGTHILEVGCGIGNITELLLKNKNTKLVVGVDNSSECLNIVNHRLSAYKQFKSFLYDIASQDMSSLKDYNFDTIVCMNVLEHIKDDFKTLNNMAEFYPHSTLVLLVPAIGELYGTTDKVVGHFRRYDKENLEEKLKRAGWKIHKGSYLNLLGIPIWFLQGKILRRSLLIPEQISFMDKFIFLEILLEKIFPLPIGLSLFYICRKE